MSEPSQKRPAAMAFILITLFIDVMGIGIIIPVLPALIKQFVGGSTDVASWYLGVISASYALMQFLCAPVMGALSDHFGRRPVLLASLFGLAIDFLIQGFSPTIGWLFVGRLIAGVMGASFTTAHAYIADVSTPENRAQNFGLAGVMFGLGFIFGPVFGGLLGGVHLRLPFFVSAGLALVNWLYGYFILPESLSAEHRSPFDLRRAHPFSTLRLLKQYPIVSGLAKSLVCLSLAQRGLENVWVLFTMFMFNWSELTNGLVLGLVGVMAVIVQGGLVRPFISYFGEKQAVIFGLAVSAIAFAGYGLAVHGWMVLAFIVFGSLGGIAGPAIQSIVAGAVPASDQGKIQGALTSLVSLTNIVAPLLFTTAVFGYFTSEHAPVQVAGAPFLLGSTLIFIALAIAIRVFRRLPD